jgi:hypothetical protein
MNTLLKISLSLIFLFSCSPKKNAVLKPVFTADEILDPVKCTRDTNQTYALYLPQNYTSEKKWPVIYFFDAHARGRLPIQNYRDWANHYGYIIAGSNYSKNGLPVEAINAHVNMFRDDVFQKLSIDNQRVYTAGFSGGAKVAGAVAILDGGISGVIACGAGFPEIGQPITHRFHFIGFAGDEDFNLLSMKFLDGNLDRMGYRHDLISFHGKHEWPSKEIMQYAFLWLQINEMKDKLIPINNALLKEIVDAEQIKITQLEKQRDFLGAFIGYRRLASYLDGLTDNSKFKQKAEELANSRLVRAATNHSFVIEKQETEIQQTYVPAFTNRDIGWWTKEISQLNRAANDTTDYEKSLMNKRLLNFLSLLAYSNSTGALNDSPVPSAEKFLKIYTMVDPTNSEHRYLTACLWMKKNKPSQALAAFREAADLGFNDRERAQDDPLLSSLRDKKEFMDILAQMK